MKKIIIISAILAVAMLSISGVSVKANNSNNGVPFQEIWDAIDELRGDLFDPTSLIARVGNLEDTIDSFFDVFTSITDHEEDVDNLQIQINSLQNQLNDLESYCEECCEEECVPTDELCDGLDNDCDEEIDEGNPESGQECMVDGAQGECMNGLTTCEAGGLLCVAVNEPTEEICDGLDNDCDGEVDEGVVDVLNGCGPCVDLDDDSTWGGKIVYEYSSYRVKDDVLLCEKTYTFGANENISIINPNLNNILNCNNATIIGASTAPGTTSAIGARYYNCGKFGACHAYTQILNCNIENFNTGITVYMADDVTVKNNNISNVNTGIILLGSHDSFVLDNTVTNTQEGIGVLLGQNYPLNFSRKPTGNLVEGNTVATSSQYGLHLTYSVENEVAGNTVTGSGLYGIYLYDDYNSLVYNNIFNNSSNAHSYSPSSFTTIWNISKTPGTNIIGGPNLGGNYWSDYTGTDDDSDGLGDTDLPYTSGGDIHAGGDSLPLVY